jgi:hypothetical protein
VPYILHRCSNHRHVHVCSYTQYYAEYISRSPRIQSCPIPSVQPRGLRSFQDVRYSEYCLLWCQVSACTDLQDVTSQTIAVSACIRWGLSAFFKMFLSVDWSCVYSVLYCPDLSSIQ